MRILMVQPAVAPEKGGAQWNTARLGIGLADRGHSVRLVGAYDTVPGLRNELETASVEVAPFNIHRSRLRVVPKLAREIASFRPDVTHSCPRHTDILRAVTTTSRPASIPERNLALRGNSDEQS